MKRLNIGGYEMKFREIPSGSCAVGSTLEEISDEVHRLAYTGIEKEWLLKEVPQHTVYVPSFYMAETVVPNLLWRDFLVSTGKSVDELLGLPLDWPAVVLNMEDVEEFCNWASQFTEYPLELPTEYQWEKAARGIDGRRFPWGDEFNSDLCNTRESEHGSFRPVSDLIEGASPYGIIQMAGNIEEWTSECYKPYPGGEEITDRFGGKEDYYVVRGGKYSSFADLARCARRHGLTPKAKVGIRLVFDLHSEESQ